MLHPVSVPVFPWTPCPSIIFMFGQYHKPGGTLYILTQFMIHIIQVESRDSLEGKKVDYILNFLGYFDFTFQSKI